jgi:hypothetical protein
MRARRSRCLIQTKVHLLLTSCIYICSYKRFFELDLGVNFRFLLNLVEKSSLHLHCLIFSLLSAAWSLRPQSTSSTSFPLVARLISPDSHTISRTTVYTRNIISQRSIFLRQPASSSGAELCSVWSLYQNYGSLRVGHPSSPLIVMAYMIKSIAPIHCRFYPMHRARLERQ